MSKTRIIEATKIVFSPKWLLLLGLLTVYYFAFMKEAIDLYTKGKTTIAQSMINEQDITNRTMPILVFCPNPSFKLSFFENGQFDVFAQEFFWHFIRIQNYPVQNRSMVEIYDEMTYEFDKDYMIYLPPPRQIRLDTFFN